MFELENAMTLLDYPWAPSVVWQKPASRILASRRRCFPVSTLSFTQLKTRRKNRENREMPKMSPNTPRCKANFGFFSICKLHAARKTAIEQSVFDSTNSQEEAPVFCWLAWYWVRISIYTKELIVLANHPIFHFACNQYNNYCNFPH